LVDTKKYISILTRARGILNHPVCCHTLRDFNRFFVPRVQRKKESVPAMNEYNRGVQLDEFREPHLKQE